MIGATGRLLTFEAYQEIGGAVGALANRADEIYRSLTAEAQGLAQQMFMRLVTLGEGAEDTRRRTTQAELLLLTDNNGSDGRNHRSVFRLSLAVTRS